MKVATHGKLYVGRLEVFKPIHDLTPKQREALAIRLVGWGNAIHVGDATGRLLVDLYVEVE